VLLINEEDLDEGEEKEKAWEERWKHKQRDKGGLENRQILVVQETMANPQTTHSELLLRPKLDGGGVVDIPAKP
jgi:hypothetical protein